MKAKDLFGLAVRIIGLALLYQGLTAVPNALTSLWPGFTHFYWRNIFPSALIIGWPLLIGYWLVRGAPWLMELAYGRTTEAHENPGGTASPGSSKSS